jgi:hypothetical protein
MRDIKQPKMCPANRFYEAVGAGLPIFFDRNCVPAIDIPQDVNVFTVCSAKDIANFDLELVQKTQRNIWGQCDYRQELIDDIAKLFYKYAIL